MKQTTKKITMESAMNNPRNRGFHLIVVNGKLYKAKTGEGASKILDKIHHELPKHRPAITYLPDAESLILWV